MEISEKILINKVLRAYKGSNAFLLSLKKSLSGKYCEKVMVGNKSYKILTDKQYLAAKSNKDLFK